MGKPTFSVGIKRKQSLTPPQTGQSTQTLVPVPLRQPPGGGCGRPARSLALPGGNGGCHGGKPRLTLDETQRQQLGEGRVPLRQHRKDLTSGGWRVLPYFMLSCLLPLKSVDLPCEYCFWPPMLGLTGASLVQIRILQDLLHSETIPAPPAQAPEWHAISTRKQANQPMDQPNLQCPKGTPTSLHSWRSHPRNGMDRLCEMATCGLNETGPDLIMDKPICMQSTRCAV